MGDNGRVDDEKGADKSEDYFFVEGDSASETPVPIHIPSNDHIKPSAMKTVSESHAFELMKSSLREIIDLIEESRLDEVELGRGAELGSRYIGKNAQNPLFLVEEVNNGLVCHRTIEISIF